MTISGLYSVFSRGLATPCDALPNSKEVYDQLWKGEWKKEKLRQKGFSDVWRCGPLRHDWPKPNQAWCNKLK